ncbi:hypothetical protein FACS189468_4980 [Spirochaetia bacterium]|nr:hypothetical protein FACS189468_4980 [Spirochaetia bacterium]
MVLFLEGKASRLILAAYLVFAVPGIGAFAATEPLRSIVFSGDTPISEGFFTPVELTIDYLAEGETMMNKAGGYSFSPLRTGALRILMPSGVPNTGSVPAQLCLKTAEKAHHPDIKNAAPLKLRI